MQISPNILKIIKNYTAICTNYSAHISAVQNFKYVTYTQCDCVEYLFGLVKRHYGFTSF